MDRLRLILTDTSLFRKCYLICLFFCHVSFIQIPAYCALVLLFLWGTFLLFYNEKHKRTIHKMRFGLWIFLYLLFSTITAIIHIKDNFFANVVMQLHVAICFFLFYGMHTEKHFNFRTELYSICKFVVYTTAIIGVIGLTFLMAGISFEVMSVKFIIYENRFTGIYANPNALGFICVVALMCIHILTKTDFLDLSKGERVSRIWLFSSLVINGISLFLCDSNGAILLLLCYIGVFVLYKMFGAEHVYSKKQIITKMIACVLAGLFIAGSVMFVKFFTQAGFTTILDAANVPTESVSEYEGEVFEATNRITFSHINKNIDSGRFKLWREALSLFSDFPLFGIGKGNVYEYGENKFDNGIHLSDLYGEALSPYTTDFHNGYVTILVCSGIFGFTIFSIFGIRFAKHISKHVFKAKNLKNSCLPCLYSFLCAYLVYALIEKTLLYDMSFRVIFFWIVMGYVSCFLCQYEPDYREDVNVFTRKLRKTSI